MNTVKIKRNNSHNDLSAALDQCVEAAVASGVSESQLVYRLIEKLQARSKNNVVPLRTEPQKKSYNPEAGP
jgi:hypothetical protein